MIDTTHIISNLKKLLHKEAVVTKRVPAYPTREWALGLSVVSVLVLVAAGVATMWYHVASSTNRDVVTVNSVPVPYINAKVDQALLIWRARANQYEVETGMVSGGQDTEAPLEEVSVPEVLATTTPATSTTTEETLPIEPDTVVEEIPAPPSDAPQISI
jgi:hypothetical protein